VSFSTESTVTSYVVHGTLRMPLRFGITMAITSSTSATERTSARPRSRGSTSATFHVTAGMVIRPSFRTVPSEPAPPVTMYTSLSAKRASLPNESSAAAHGPWLLSAACGRMLVV
jgi:hypothetical protein